MEGVVEGESVWTRSLYQLSGDGDRCICQAPGSNSVRLNLLIEQITCFRRSIPSPPTTPPFSLIFYGEGRERENKLPFGFIKL